MKDRCKKRKGIGGFISVTAARCGVPLWGLGEKERMEARRRTFGLGVGLWATGNGMGSSG